MNRRVGIALLGVVVLVAGLAVALFMRGREGKERPKEYMKLGEYVSPEDSLPRVRFFDGDQVSLNDRCAVRKVKLNNKMTPVYVNGQPIGFC
jgi:hypothetical protein